MCAPNDRFFYRSRLNQDILYWYFPCRWRCWLMRLHGYSLCCSPCRRTAASQNCFWCVWKGNPTAKYSEVGIGLTRWPLGHIIAKTLLRLLQSRETWCPWPSKMPDWGCLDSSTITTQFPNPQCNVTGKARFGKFANPIVRVRAGKVRFCANVTVASVRTNKNSRL